jgi:succinate dehydrogenase/fumarate reductase flavoprotein subunit
MRDWASGPWPDPTPAGQDPPPVAPAPSRPGEASPALEADVAAVRDLMWRNVGVFRDGVGLSAAGRDLDQRWAAIDRDLRSGAPLDADRWRHLSLTVVARLIARAALCREESRGAHARADFAERDDLHWRRRLYDTRDH